MSVIKKMSRENKQKISTRLFLTLGVGFVVAGISMIYFFNHQMKTQALHEAELVAQTILNRNLAIHTYFSQRLKPNLFAATNLAEQNDYFDPVWMSSTYAVREIEKYSKSINPSEYYYKECAINARNPENEADDHEKAFLKKINNDPELVLLSAVRKLDGRPFFVVLRRGEVIEESCLRCHSTPDKAPGNLVKTYGPDRSFNRRIGEVVSAISIRVPLSTAYLQANRISIRLSFFLIALLFVLFLILFWLNNHLIFKPLSTIRKKVLQISSDEKYLGEEIPLPSGKELSEVTSAFNVMSKNLRDNVDELKELVDLRKRSEENLRVLSSKLMDAQDEERRRIGNELHDELAQNLSVVKLWAESTRMHLGKNTLDRAVDCLDKIPPMIQKSIEEIRRISKNLRPSMLENMGIIDTIEALCDEFVENHPGIKIERNVDVEENNVPEHLKIVLFRLIQEALTNVAKHSQADSVRLFLSGSNGEISLSLRDNGRGFDMEGVLSLGYEERGIGLTSMNERVTQSGGSLSIDSTDSGGTHLKASWAGLR